jgi:peptide/nickel transport system ATP-binding protein
MPLNHSPILRIDNLTVAYRQRGVWLEAVRDVSLEIAAGQTYGLVGESGSGKSTLALTVMRYLPENGRVRQGRIEFDGRNLLSLSSAEMGRIWGGQLAMVPQDPLSALNPAIHVGEQLAEPLRLHEGMGRTAARRRAVELLAMARIADPERVAASYPHQISGGMQQRVMIALALSTGPKLLVLDEPTTGLDVTTQAAILDLVRDLMREQGTAALYVSHNLGVVARICDRVAVLYAGELVEDTATVDLFRQPLHPYSQGLLDSIPRLGQNKRTVQLQAIPGQIPSLGERPAGCVYAPRCPLAIEICWQRPSLDVVERGDEGSGTRGNLGELALARPRAGTQEAGLRIDGRLVRCHRWSEIQAGLVSARQIQRPAQTQSPSNGTATVLQTEDLAVHFALRRSLLDMVANRPARQVRAVNGVNLAIDSGQTLGLVGESGSGKTTLARAVIGLVERTGGDIELFNVSLPPALSQRDTETLRHLQMVFQNPDEALNPYLLVGESLRRPFITLLDKSPQEADELVGQMLAAVRLPADYAQRLPSQLSGGERQRVAIARAFAANPSLLLADEPVSSLDVSVQATILNLLNELQQERGNAILFISHDLAVVGYLADVVAVMYLGQLMEVAGAADLFTPPYHPYTEALLSAIPVPDPTAEQEQIRLEGELPSPTAVLTGCPFHTRCPRFLGDICVQETPPWREGENGARIFCHIPLEELRAAQESSN